jgi:hypothetical protein
VRRYDARLELDATSGLLLEIPTMIQVEILERTSALRDRCDVNAPPSKERKGHGNKLKRIYIYISCYRPWRPIGLREVNVPTSLRPAVANLIHLEGQI